MNCLHSLPACDDAGASGSHEVSGHMCAALVRSRVRWGS